MAKTPDTNPSTNPDALFIGIDLGTSGARAIAIDTNGTPHGDGRCKLPEADRRSPAAWWHAVSNALDDLLKQINRTTVKAISIDATSGTVLAIDHSGEPLADALMYNDPIDTEDILQAIANNAPEASAVHGSSSALARAITLQRATAHQTASTASSIVAIVHQADWLAGKLTGIFTTSDESNALKTGYDPISRRWPEWISATGLDPAVLPKVLPCGRVNQPVSSDSAARFELPGSTQLVTGATDGCASFLATGAQDIGDCVTALGTTITMKILSDKPLFEPKYGIYSHRIGNRWLAGGASNSGGNVLANFFTNDQIASYSQQIDVNTSSKLNYYPLIKSGERFPHNDANWQPQLSPRPDSDIEFLQGLLEGMADIEALGYQRLQELGAPTPTSVRTVGGGAGNQQWTSIRQRKLGTSFAESLSTDAAVGVARLALQAFHKTD